MRGRLLFVTGAARSGKSRYAESLVLPMGSPVVYVATAEAGDEEMRRRVAEHRRRRPRGWITLEATRNVADRLGETDHGARVILLDCLSLLVSNLLLDAARELGEGPRMEREAYRAVDAELDALMDWYRRSAASLVVVSNEVGWGVVPPHRLGRLYRDLLGSANQRVAAECTDAFLMVAGIPLPLKGSGARPS